MTEQEWLVCDDPRMMAASLRGMRSERKCRLLGCAVCRLLYLRFMDPKGRKALEVAERFADSEATLAELLQVHREAEAHWEENVNMPAALVAFEITDPTPLVELNLAEDPIARTLEASKPRTINAAAKQDECHRLLYSILCIFGPGCVQSVIVNPTWLSSTVKNLAESIYTDKAFEKMPILADALEDAGCTSQEILEHCRSGGEHVRGCWALDLVLGKE